MKKQQVRVAETFTIIFVSLTILANLFIDRFEFTWYNVAQVIILLPCIVSAALLLRLWRKQSKRARAADAYRKRMMISGNF